MLYVSGTLAILALAGFVALYLSFSRNENQRHLIIQRIEALLDACRGKLNEESIREIETDLEGGEYEVAYKALMVAVDEETTYEFDESCKLIAQDLEMQFYGALRHLYERAPNTVRPDEAANTGMKQ